MIVDGEHGEFRVLQHGDLLRRRRPDEQTVHTDIDLRETMACPQILGIAQNAAEQPQPLVGRIDVAVGLSVPHVQVQQVVDSAQFRPAVPEGTTW